MSDLFTGGLQMAKIDGTKVRQFRESKGLTQLYLATVVEVTTDTISRWENKRYPSIKMENALKLAEALEVPLEDILQEDDKTQPADLKEREEKIFIQEKRSTAGLNMKTSVVIWSAVLLAVFTIGMWWFAKSPQITPVTALRILPPHIPAGYPFPVIITVEAEKEEHFSLLLKETLPPDCTLVSSAPEYTSMNNKTGELKWIKKINGNMVVFTYLAKSAKEAVNQEKLVFTGEVTLKNDIGRKSNVTGSNSLVINNYHWADDDSDGKVSDEEILTAYDKYGALDALDFDWNLLDSLWSGQGYKWDKTAGSFIVIE